MFGDWNSKDAVLKAANYCVEWREKCLIHQFGCKQFQSWKTESVKIFSRTFKEVSIDSANEAENQL